MAAGGSAAASSKDHGPAVAFENPMYDDPSQQYGGDYGNSTQNPVYGGEDYNQGDYGQTDPADDGGLYDEPELHNAPGGVGYLDVQPDDQVEDEEDDEEDDD